MHAVYMRLAGKDTAYCGETATHHSQAGHETIRKAWQHLEGEDSVYSE